MLALSPRSYSAANPQQTWGKLALTPSINQSVCQTCTAQVRRGRVHQPKTATDTSPPVHRHSFRLHHWLSCCSLTTVCWCCTYAKHTSYLLLACMDKTEQSDDTLAAWLTRQ